MPTEPDVARQVAKAVEEHEALDPSALALTLTLYRSMGAFDRASTAELVPFGLTPSLFNILTVLHRAEGPMTMGRLGEAVSVRPANLTSLVDTLARRSLVERRINPSDRRSYLMANTAAGEELLAQFLPSHWRYLENLTAGLSRDERLQLTDLLERLRQSVVAGLSKAGEAERPG